MTLGLLIALLLSAILPCKPVRSQSTSPLSYTFDECDQVKEASLRDELNRITQFVFAEEQGGMDVSAIVDRNWNSLNLDATVDAAVESATERVMKETGLWERVISGWSPSKAEELTKKVATNAFDSTDFREAFDVLSLNITDDVVTEIRLMTVKSASSALLCVQTFVGDTMSPTMAAVLEVEIQERLSKIPFPEDEDLNLLDIVRANPNLTGGVALIIGTQIARTLGKQLAQKIAGRVAGRILARVGSTVVPLVGWVIGAGLIAWDLFNSKDGSLPQIRDALQDSEVKEEIRAQVTEKVSDELRVELPQLARTVSNDVFSQWQEFRRKHSRVLDLTRASQRFQSILDNTPVEMVKTLADLVELAEEKLGTEGLVNLIDTGKFERILSLPEEALEIFRVTGDAAVVIAWADLAGEVIVKVVELELYRVASTSDFRDRADLETVIALENADLIQKLMLLDQEERDTLLGLSTAHIKQVLEALSEEELSGLAKDYLAELEPQERNVVVDRILTVPEVFPELRVDAVRRELLESQDIEATLNYIIQRTKSVPWIGEVVQMSAAIGPVLSGDLPWALFWRYDVAALGNILLALMGLIALIIVWRRVSPRRRQDVNVNVVLPEKRGINEIDTNAKRIESRGGEEDGQ